MLLEVAFWCSVALVFYAYLGYPVALLALSCFRNRPVRKGLATRPVTFIITAYNEEQRIGDKIANTLAQHYPPDLLDVIVASDCSTDRTDEIVERYAGRVRLVRAAERRGKESAQRLAVEAASGEILVFSDVATALASDGVANIVKNFADPTVGCVSSVDRFIDRDGRVGGEGAYIRYEMWLRALETRVNTLVGLSGSFFAARREVCRNWAVNRQSDFTTLLNAVDLGLRGISDPESVGFYRDIVDDRREFERKVRTVVRGLAVFAGHLRMMNPLGYGLFSWQLASHKLCRWLVPFGMIGAAVANILLASRSPFYGTTLLLQFGFYGAAAAGAWTTRGLLRVPAFLVVANFAVLTAWFRYARGERIQLWAPSHRPAALPQTDFSSQG